VFDGTVRLEVEHSTRYRYASPVSLAHHRAHLRPIQDAAQVLEDFDLELDPPPAGRRASLDSFGNPQLHFEIAGTHERLHVRSRSRLALRPRFAGFDAAATLPWEQVAEALRYRPRASPLPAAEFVHPSPYVPRLPALRALVAPLLEPGRPVAALALALMHEIHTGFAYESQSTTVDTPLVSVLAQRHGVCQDFAHAMIGALRSAGLAARYVSGYLLTQAPEDGRTLLGADASHAWVQVWCPPVSASGSTSAAGEDTPPAASPDFWLDLDPTNDCVPAAGHVRLAVGRDYGDVAPLRGVIRGGGEHRLEVAVRTRRIAAPALSDSQTSPAGP
jgi:transglutaminase-like putative cysteine protease